jgi:hypothetical protein
MIFYCTGAWGMDFVSSSPLFSTTPFFQNFHINHSFFKIFIIECNTWYNGKYDWVTSCDKFAV